MYGDVKKFMIVNSCCCVSVRPAGLVPANEAASFLWQGWTNSFHSANIDLMINMCGCGCFSHRHQWAK